MNGLSTRITEVSTLEWKDKFYKDNGKKVFHSSAVEMGLISGSISVHIYGVEPWPQYSGWVRVGTAHHWDIEVSPKFETVSGAKEWLEAHAKVAAQRYLNRCQALTDKARAACHSLGVS